MKGINFLIFFPYRAVHNFGVCFFYFATLWVTQLRVFELGVTEIHIWSMNLLCVGVRWKHIKDITQKSLVCFWADTAKLCFAFCWFAYILCVFIRQLTHKYHFQVHYQCNILCAFIRQITHIHSLYLYSHLCYYQCKILVVLS